MKIPLASRLPVRIPPISLEILIVRLRQSGIRVFGHPEFLLQMLSGKNDTLVLSIWQESASDNQKLTLTVVDGRFYSDYVIEYVLPYNDWEFKIIKEELELNQIPEPGMPIKGRVSILLQEEIRWAENPANQIDTILKRIEGTFIVEKK